MVLAWEALLEAEKAGGRTVAVGTTVLSATHVAMIFVDRGEVGSTALGASEEGFRSLAVRDGVT
jgi:hypothetical protein